MSKFEILCNVSFMNSTMCALQRNYQIGVQKVVFLYESINAMAIEKFIYLLITWFTLTGIQYPNGQWISGMEILPQN